LQAYLANPIIPDGMAGSRVTVWWYEDTDAANASAGLGPQGSGTATESTNLINIANHGLVAGNMIVFTSKTGGAGLLLFTPYFVVGTPTTNAFQVSRTPGGTVVDFTSNATALTARKVTPPGGQPLHQHAFTLPRGGSINDLLPEIDAMGVKVREAYEQAAALNAQAHIGTTRAVPA
jgi:hypothetical protein